MVETLVGVVVGGIIGLVPSILTSLNEQKRFEKQLRFDAEIKKIEVYETAKQKALTDFLDVIGHAIGEKKTFHVQIHVDLLHKLESSFHKALPFLSLEAQGKLISLYGDLSNLFLEAHPRDNIPSYEMTSAQMGQIIHEELSKPYNELSKAYNRK